ncbi:uncharacterized protein B0H18DRAFT_427579 [Fomitopsis serialis]|uniref:uncharacterized protein n=1 Tax=Fomitopsis serialis TaxID=139415 RepID=UPI0020088CCB|nr:uncharacterized protein B0H18DRAFT_427579 [Neoantrodia serialis]KAH9910810.1 hypothetical protein B0H18DRAFT_427579 [Neoantrodia serialis]
MSPAHDSTRSTWVSCSTPAPEQPVQTVFVKPPRDCTTTSTSQAPKCSNGLRAPEPNPATVSIAVRAIKSMRSLARMASWAQLTNNGEQGNAEPGTKAAAPKKMKETSDAGKKKKGKKKDEEKKKEEKGLVKRREKEETKQSTLRYSSSSFEAGALSTQVSNTSSTGSAEVGQPQAPSRLSVDSAHLIMNTQGRPTSIISSGSSL